MDTSERAIQVRASESRKRRFRSVAEKRRIVDETLEPGAPAARVARAHGVNAIQEFSWPRQYRQGLLGEGHAETVNLLPVQVTGTMASKAHRSVSPHATCRGVSRIVPCTRRVPQFGVFAVFLYFVVSWNQ